MAEPKSLRIPGHQGVEINVVDYGGDGPPLLLCHCTGTFARVWDPVAARLRGSFHLYAPDSRGQGDSEQPQEPEAYDWINSGRDLLAVVDALGFRGEVYAAGHSAGGAHVAYAQWLRPGTFARIALIDAIIGPREFFTGENPLATLVRRRKNTFENLDIARERLGAKPPMNTWCPDAFNAYLAHAFRTQDDGQLVLKCPGPVEAWVYEHGGACDLFEHLHEVDVPALVVAGGDSYVATMAEMQAHRLPQSTHHTHPNVGHFIPQEDPPGTASFLQNWFTPQSLVS